MNYKIKKFIKICCILALIVILVFVFFRINRFLEIDSCLDSGGRWNYETNQCEYE